MCTYLQITAAEKLLLAITLPLLLGTLLLRCGILTRPCPHYYVFTTGQWNHYYLFSLPSHKLMTELECRPKTGPQHQLRDCQD